MTPSMTGKRVVVTGANSGIGRIAALELARAGAEVILVCRDAVRGAEAVADIQSKAGSDRLALMLCDISSQQDIQRFCREFRSRYDQLDVLVNNAGAYFAERQESVDGIELTFALNHLGYFLMARGLMSNLEASPAGRIVNVASMGHRLGKIDLEDLEWTRRTYRALRAYSDSKLMNIQFTSELARRCADKGVTANCLHPGAIRSGFAVSEVGFFGALVRLGSPFLTSPEKGARASIYLASSPNVAQVSGAYFVGEKVRTPSRAARNREDSEALWAASEPYVRYDPTG